MSARLASRSSAAPGKFPLNPQRRVMIAKIHVAKKELGFDDGDYRALLERVTGKASSAKMNAGEMGKVLDELARLGWAPGTSKKPGKPRPASHPAAKKARAMFLSLGLLGVIRNPSEAALEAFARRQLGCDKLQWADQSQVYKLIEAMKKIAARHGWDQDVAGLSDPIWTLKLRLVGAILRRLKARGAAGPQETLAGAAAAVVGESKGVLALSERDLETIASVLGARLAASAFEDSAA